MRDLKLCAIIVHRQNTWNSTMQSLVTWLIKKTDRQKVLRRSIAEIIEINSSFCADIPSIHKSMSTLICTVRWHAAKEISAQPNTVML